MSPQLDSHKTGGLKRRKALSQCPCTSKLYSNKMQRLESGVLKAKSGRTMSLQLDRQETVGMKGPREKVIGPSTSTVIGLEGWKRGKPARH